MRQSASCVLERISIRFEQECQRHHLDQERVDGIGKCLRFAFELTEERTRFLHRVRAARVDQILELLEAVQSEIPRCGDRTPVDKKSSHAKGKYVTASREQDSLGRVLAHEAGYSNHPADPGGPLIDKLADDGHPTDEARGFGLVMLSAVAATLPVAR